MNKILDLIFAIGIFLAIISFVYRETYVYYLIIILGMILLLFYLMFYLKKYYKLLIFISILVLIYLSKIIFYQEIGATIDVPLLIASFGFGLYLIEEDKGRKIISLFYIGIILILFYYFIINMNPNEISDYSSGNIVNFIVLSFSILMIGLFYKKDRKIIIAPALVSLIVSLWTVGRMGIICSFLLVVGIMLFKYMNKLSKLTISLLLLFFSIAGYFIVEFLVNFSEAVVSKFGRRETSGLGPLTEDPRVLIIEDYINQLDISKLIYGFDFSENYFYGFINLHNGFLDIHYLLGIGGFLILILMAYTLFISLKTKQYLFFILLICLFIRMATDTVMLVGVYDFILFFLIFSVFNEKSIRNIKEEA